LGSYIGSLMDKGWTIVDHDESALTKDFVPRMATFTRYELFAEFTTELMVRIKAFCKAVDEFEAKRCRNKLFDHGVIVEYGNYAWRIFESGTRGQTGTKRDICPPTVPI
jgi:hypothetical protein